MQLVILQKVRFLTTRPSYDTINLIQFSLITRKIFPRRYNWNLIKLPAIQFISKRVLLLCYVQAKSKARVCKVSEAFSLCKQLQCIKY